MKKRNLQLTLTAMFLALGLVWPMLFHAAGLGSIFLPMFWPVAAGAFFLRTPYALTLALMTPLLSSLMTGMPPFAPPLVYVMMAELFVLNATIRFLYAYTNWGVVWKLAAGLLLSRLTLVFTVSLIAPLLGWPAQLFSMAAVIRGLPGILGMLVFLPVIISRLRHENLYRQQG